MAFLKWFTSTYFSGAQEECWGTFTISTRLGCLTPIQILPTCLKVFNHPGQVVDLVVVIIIFSLPFIKVIELPM